MTGGGEGGGNHVARAQCGNASKDILELDRRQSSYFSANAVSARLRRQCDSSGRKPRSHNAFNAQSR